MNDKFCGEHVTLSERVARLETKVDTSLKQNVWLIRLMVVSLTGIVGLLGKMLMEVVAK
jgi:hypothetical protein